MENFELYFGLGLEHILDVKGYDHILFVLALAAVYRLSDWKKILILVTAFTIGHSITLAAATWGLINVRAEIIEFIIPITILITAISNLFVNDTQLAGKRLQLNYAYALFFGLIHGLGFSNYLRSLLGGEQDITAPLFAFNIGLEIGQIIIVALFLILSFIVVNLLKLEQKWWKISVSVIITLMTVALFQDRIFWT